MPDLVGKFDSDPSMDTLIALSPCLVVPLMSKGEINGIIILGGRINEDKDFSETEKEYLLNIASLAGIAIHNASLYEMATTDMMTETQDPPLFSDDTHRRDSNGPSSITGRFP